MHLFVNSPESGFARVISEVLTVRYPLSYHVKYATRPLSGNQTLLCHPAVSQFRAGEKYTSKSSPVLQRCTLIQSQRGEAVELNCQPPPLPPRTLKHCGVWEEVGTSAGGDGGKVEGVKREKKVETFYVACSPMAEQERERLCV